MSTAVMRQNSMFEFGEFIMKNAVGSPDISPGSHLSTESVDACRVRYALSRMNSSPANVTATANLVNNLLGNLQQHRRLERTQSAPTTSVAAALVASSVNTSRYKTELCRPFEEFGVCKYGDKCQFAHGQNELRTLARHPKYKTELCRTYHTVGFCPYGPRCHFVHNQEEALRLAASAGMISPCSQLPRPRPVALSPALSLGSPSPPSSLSQSPTSSLRSFFASEPELNSQGVEVRLPVFNRIVARSPKSALGDKLRKCDKKFLKV